MRVGDGRRSKPRGLWLAVLHEAGLYVLSRRYGMGPDGTKTFSLSAKRFKSGLVFVQTYQP